MEEWHGINRGVNSCCNRLVTVIEKEILPFLQSFVLHFFASSYFLQVARIKAPFVAFVLKNAGEQFRRRCK